MSNKRMKNAQGDWCDFFLQHLANRHMSSQVEENTLKEKRLLFTNVVCDEGDKHIG